MDELKTLQERAAEGREAYGSRNVGPFTIGREWESDKCTECGHPWDDHYATNGGKMHCHALGTGTSGDCKCKKFGRPESWPKIGNTEAKVEAGRAMFGSMKNAERISLMFDSPSVAQRAEGLIRTSAHPELSGSSVVVDYSALGGVHEDLKAEDLMQYLGSETMKNAGQACPSCGKMVQTADGMMKHLIHDHDWKPSRTTDAVVSLFGEEGKKATGSDYAKNEAKPKPKVGELVKFSKHGGEIRKIHTVSGDYVEAGDVGMSVDSLEPDGAGHWVSHEKVGGGIGRASNTADNVEAGRAMFGSAKNAGLVRVGDDVTISHGSATDKVAKIVAYDSATKEYELKVVSTGEILRLDRDDFWI